MYTYELEKPRRTLESSRPLEGSPRVAIVGSRDAEKPALDYARTLASLVAAAGGIVVSGGAEGVDFEAHEGALAVGGRTWVVAPTGRNHVSPRKHAALFQQVQESAGAVVWPFPPEQHAHRSIFHERNDVLVALSDAVVVVQATSVRSGTFSTARKTLLADKPLWVVPLPPWLDLVGGTVALIRRLDIRVLYQTQELLASVGLSAPLDEVRRENPDQQAVLDALAKPLHRDHLAERTGLKIAQLAVILFQLQMEGLVREMIDGRVQRL